MAYLVSRSMETRIINPRLIHKLTICYHDAAVCKLRNRQTHIGIRAGASIDILEGSIMSDIFVGVSGVFFSLVS